MKMSAARGFTIIEVMLFLAISGLLAVLLLGGWTVMINTQRYKDSVDTVYGYIQDQYNLVYNVENERDSSLQCIGGQVMTGGGGATETNRGQSECILMVRLIKVSNGTTLQSYAVVGSQPSEEPMGSENEVIWAYRPTVVTQSIGLTEARQTVPWGAVMTGTSGNTAPANLNIILLRSPTSGTIHRYIVSAAAATTPTIAQADIHSTNEQDDRTFCFNPGAVVQSGRQAVVIRAYASSRNSVETLGSDNGC